MSRGKKYSWASSGGIQERILEAALTRFRERGYTDTTMSEIVAAADASVGSIYHHFGGKVELFDACYDRLTRILKTQIGLEPYEAPTPGEWEDRYLWAVWEHRDDCAVFLTWDCPAKFHPGATIAENYPDVSPHTARMLGAITLEAMRIITEDGDDLVGKVIDGTVKLLNIVRGEVF